MAFGPKDPDELSRGAGELGRIIRKYETSGKPFVAALPGTALGGGMEIALGCHYRIANADNVRAKYGLPEVSVGLLPGAGGTQRLPRMLGYQASLPLLMEGKQLNAAKAAEGRRARQGRSRR